MELSKKMEEALNEQIKEEMASAYIYLSMAAYFESVNLGGFARWMTAQSNEELEHAMKFYGYIHDRGGRVIFAGAGAAARRTLRGPSTSLKRRWPTSSTSPAASNKLYAQAVEERTMPAGRLLQWYRGRAG